MNFSYKNMYHSHVNIPYEPYILISYAYTCSLFCLVMAHNPIPIRYSCIRGPVGRVTAGQQRQNGHQRCPYRYLYNTQLHLPFSCTVGQTLEVPVPVTVLSSIPLSYNLYSNVDSRGTHAGCTHIALSSTYPDCKYLDSEPLCHFLLSLMNHKQSSSIIKCYMYRYTCTISYTCHVLCITS